MRIGGDLFFFVSVRPPLPRCRAAGKTRLPHPCSAFVCSAPSSMIALFGCFIAQVRSTSQSETETFEVVQIGSSSCYEGDLKIRVI